MAAAESSLLLLVQKSSLTMENRAYSEGRKEAGYIFIVLWERCFCMAANGIREEYLFQMLPYLFYMWHTLLGFISKKKMTESCTQCSCDVTV